MSDKTETCEVCGGDGVETCDNPDHGWTDMGAGELGRLGCPVCGHDPDHKVQGSICPECNGTGRQPQVGPLFRRR